MITTMKNKRFMPLFFSHIFGAFNDNLIKNIFVLLAAYKMTQGSFWWMLVAFVLYGGAFLATTLYAGPMCDKWSRTVLIRHIKLLEIGVMAFALFSISLESRLLMLLTLAMLGFCTSFVRCAKGAILPNLVEDSGLLSANALLNGATFAMSVLCSVIFAMVLPLDLSLNVLGGVLIAVAVAGYLAALALPKIAPADKCALCQKNPLSYLFDFSRYVEGNLSLRFYIASIAWYWLVGGVVAFFAFDYAEDILGAKASVVLFLTAIFSVGYVLGAIVCAQLHKVGRFVWSVPLSALGVSVFLFGFVFVSCFIHPSETLTTVPQFLALGLWAYGLILCTMMIAVCGACFAIPFYALIQEKTPNAQLGRVIGFMTFVCAMAVMGAVFIVLALKMLQVSILAVFFVLAIVNLFFAAYTCQILPLQTRRAIFKRLLIKLFHVQVEGLENLKKAGKRALIITNHTSYLDALIISCFIDEKITFSLTTKLQDKWWVRVFCSLMDVKFLDPVSPMAIKDMVSELKKDKLCMIFVESQIADGQSQMKMYEGPALMAQKSDASLLPIQIFGADHSIFSRLKGQTYTTWRPTIRMQILSPVKFKQNKKATFRDERRQSSSQLHDMLAVMAFNNYDTHQTLFSAMIKTMKAVGRKKYVMEDTARKPLKFKHVFLRAFILGRLISKAVSDKTVGVMLPTSNACALTVLGLFAYGKTPAMINFSSGEKQVLSTCHTAKLKTVLTAHKVVQLAKLEDLIKALEKDKVRVVYLEDLKKDLTFNDKLFAIKAMFRPAQIYAQTAPEVKSEDAAVILFTSGSEGMPKAVVLSHQNLLANIYQIPTMYDIKENDILLNCLPMFHSFGLTAGMLFPLVVGMKTVLYPTPLHYRIIPELCSSCHATVFFGTDTFLAGYAKCANPYDFNSLRIVAVGGEKLKEETRMLWADKFGLRVMEGYGATECSPFLAVNTYLHNRLGSVGRLMTGMSYRLKPVEGIKDGAELVVCGPNVMKGYMKADKPGVLQPPKDGWYETGDIVHIDEEDFIFIKGRSKRFAKIGGEMVSLLAVEQVVNQEWKDFVHGAVSIPDAKKGEQIVLITTCKDISTDKLIELFKKAGLPEIAIPKKIVITSTPPLLGTGKFDYITAKERALKEID